MDAVVNKNEIEMEIIRHCRPLHYLVCSSKNRAGKYVDVGQMKALLALGPLWVSLRLAVHHRQRAVNVCVSIGRKKNQ